ncbi:alpha-galactosidase [uncultured Duncaniella sp.]|uniref:alpha-galactosidase n=1 Tax=uncultured Duncaniella sp. TaxID=2768039 RepID=UPI0026235184|nr:alpha-galactosidase [uncultured Duncaniella sp.]
MKKLLGLFLTLIAFGSSAQGIAKKIIEIPSGDMKLTLMVGEDDRLYQLGFGDSDAEIKVPEKLPSREMEFLPCYGNGVITEAAIQATHTDGNTSTDLNYVSHRNEQFGNGVNQTVISMSDPAYKFYVDIYVRCYPENSMMEIWNTLRHDERGGKVVLYKYASASPIIKAKEYWLTQFCGRYKHEATMKEEMLSEGIKVLDSKLGVRANQFRIPSFLLSCDGCARENEGKTFAASLKWAGSFQLAFEVDWNNNLRVLTGINPVGAHYNLERGETFTTPAILWTYSDKGKGETSRNFHRWADSHSIRDPKKDRPIILNNWEATHCDFDEKRLVALFEDANKIGAELFLLDDGWFGNGEYSRDDDKHGLGDWEPSAKKLPNGLAHLAKQAVKRNVGFGIWLEPEMVNPNSRLYNEHPEWIITQQKREPILGRHQEILDLTRPEVQLYEWEIIDKTLSPSKDISYVKWDCNRYVTQPGSTYLTPSRQSHLLIDYNNNLYSLMDRFASGYPDVMAMLCSGGSGRVDYGSMQYFHSFWPSDNTDPLDRIKIQWGFSHFFPAKTMSAHVTRMGKRHLKLAIDVAMSGAFGIDLAIDRATDAERAQLAEGVRLYKSKIRSLIMEGELHRLVSPYETPLAALSYVAPDKDRAVVFLYQTEDGNVPTVRFTGLDTDKKYTVTELNLPEGEKSKFDNNLTFSGRQLMEEGLSNPLAKQFESAVLELKSI